MRPTAGDLVGAAVLTVVLVVLTILAIVAALPR